MTENRCASRGVPGREWKMLGLCLLAAAAGQLLQAVYTMLYGGAEAGRSAVSLLLAAAGMTAAFVRFARPEKGAAFGYAAMVGTAFCAAASRLLREAPGIGELAAPFWLNAGTFACLAPVGYVFYLWAMRGKGLLGLLGCYAAFLPFGVLLFALQNPAAMVAAGGISAGLLCFAAAGGWFGGRKVGQTALALGIAGLICGLMRFLLRQDPFFAEQLEARLHPERDPLGDGYRALCLRELSRAMRFAGRGEEVQLPGGADAQEFFAAVKGVELPRLMYSCGWWIGLAAGLAAAGMIAGLALLVWKRAESRMGKWMGAAVLLPAAVRTALFFAECLGYGGVRDASLPFLTGDPAELLCEGLCVGVLAAVLRADGVFLAAERKAVSRRLNYPFIRLMLWLRR